MAKFLCNIVIFYIFRMNFEDIATTMLLCPDLLDEEAVLLMLLTACESCEEPIHYKYEKFSFAKCRRMNLSSISDSKNSTFMT